MKSIKLLIFIMIVLYFPIACKDNSTDPQSNDSTLNGWKLVWADEFNYAGLPETTKWGYDVGGSGWGNNELEYYTSKRSENARVENGHLIIEARRENYEGMYYTSARLLSRGLGNWTYGRFEVKAKLPYGVGTWPAIWMLPTDWTYGNGGWPDNGEIDIMEHVGFDPGVIHGSIHTKKYNWQIGTQKTATIKESDALNNYHLYAMEWYADSICIFIDTTKYLTFKNENSGWEAWPFNKDFHFILNIAVGGTWGGQQGVDNSIFPQQMLIDYVRVYKKEE